jgi:predicted RNase H-like HicB family nuclease
METATYTAIIEKSVDGFFVGQVQEMPEAIAQGKTLEELEQNLRNALKTVLDYHREHTRNLYKGHETFQREIRLA